MQKVFVIFHNGVEWKRFSTKDKAICFLNDEIGDHPSREDYEIVALHTAHGKVDDGDEILSAQKRELARLFSEG